MGSDIDCSFSVNFLCKWPVCQLFIPRVAFLFFISYKFCYGALGMFGVTAGGW